MKRKVSSKTIISLAAAAAAFMALVTVPGSRLRGESVFLKDGSVIEGKIVKKNNLGVVIELPDTEKKEISAADIIRIADTDRYRKKALFVMKDGSVMTAHIVEESDLGYTCRISVQSKDEFKIPKSAVASMNLDSDQAGRKDSGADTAYNHSVFLKDGSILTGRTLDENVMRIILELPDKSQREISRSDILRITTGTGHLARQFLYRTDGTVVNAHIVSDESAVYICRGRIDSPREFTISKGMVRIVSKVRVDTGQPESVFLKDGSIITGTVNYAGDKTVTVTLSDGMMRDIDRGDLLRIRYDGSYLLNTYFYLKDNSRREAYLAGESDDAFFCRIAPESKDEFTIAKNDVLHLFRNPVPGGREGRREALFLKNGTIIEGFIGHRDNSTVIINLPEGKPVTVSRSDIIHITDAGRYNKKMFLYLKNRPVFEGYIVDESEAAYICRNKLNSDNEVSFAKSDVVIVSEKMLYVPIVNSIAESTESVFLRDGTVFDGAVVSKKDKVIVFKPDDGALTIIPLSDVLRTVQGRALKRKQFVEIHLAGGSSVWGYIAFEDENVYVVRKMFNSPDEFTVMKNTVSYIEHKALDEEKAAHTAAGAWIFMNGGSVIECSIIGIGESVTALLPDNRVREIRRSQIIRIRTDEDFKKLRYICLDNNSVYEGYIVDEDSHGITCRFRPGTDREIRLEKSIIKSVFAEKVRVFSVTETADTAQYDNAVFLENGSIIEGRITRENNNEVVIQLPGNRIERYPRELVLRILYHQKYKKKICISLLDKSVLTGNIVDEDSDSYSIRENLQSREERKIVKSAVNSISLDCPVEIKKEADETRCVDIFIMPCYFIPQGTFASLYNPGYGIMFNGSVHNLFAENLLLGMEIGLLKFPGKGNIAIVDGEERAAKGLFKIPVWVNAGWQFNLFNGFSLIPRFSAGYTYMSLSTCDRGKDGSDLLHDRTAVSFEPLVKCGIVSRYIIGRDYFASAAVEYGLLLESDGNIGFVSLSAGLGMQF